LLESIAAYVRQTADEVNARWGMARGRRGDKKGRVRARNTSRPRAAPGWGRARVLAIGHSTRPIEDLVELLEASGVRTLADIRTIPRSRANPQFEGPALARRLGAAGIRYVHVPPLGGLRHARKGATENAAWRNSSFRGYADHMQTPEFEEGLCQLRALARDGPVAVMCAEAVPWRCHRSLLADALLARGVLVEHITGRGRTRPHRLTPFARISGRKVTYPPADLASGGAAR
jgi:uncharacterized protein (DUF488 family)